MARSTKTKHVLDLVGETKKKPTPKPMASEKAEKTPPVPKIVEEVISEAQQQEPPAPEEEPVQELQEEAPAPAAEEEKESVHKPIITAIVCELINQELGSVAERFHLPLTDANLWELTKTALEEVRPEFSADSDSTKEKLERLRPRVISVMTKAAIKIAAKKRTAE